MGLGKPQTKEIEGHTWVVTPFPGRPANKYKMRLLKMVGPALSELLPAIGNLIDVAKSAKDKKSKEPEVDEKAILDALPKVVSTLAKHCDEDLLVNTMVELMAQSTRDGTTMDGDQFDIVFAGNDVEQLHALWFILNVNYPDFLGWAQARITGLRPQVSPETSPETSKQ